MIVRPIIKPPVNETFFYGKIISWNFRESVTYIKSRKRYCYRFTLTFDSGKILPLQRGAFHKKAEALKAREYAITQLQEKRFVPFEYTAKEYYDYWLYYYMIDEKKISYNTYMGYRNILYNYFLKVWGDKLITSLQRDDLIAALDAISYKSILNTAYGVLGGSFKYALSNGIIYLDPVKSAIKAKKKQIKKQEIELQRASEQLPKGPTPPPVYSLQQVSIIMYICKIEEPQIFMALLLALTAGLRISEVIGIKYKDIDFSHYVVYVERQLGRTTSNAGLEDGTLLTQELEPKTRKSTRSVVLAAFVIDEIILQRQRYEELRANFSNFKDYGYLCCHDDGTPYNRGFAKDAYTRLMEKCNIKKIPWRKLRNTYATILAQYDVSMKAIAASLGHYSPDFTDSTYINMEHSVYDAEREISAFAYEVLPGAKETEIIPIDDTYMLEVLP